MAAALLLEAAPDLPWLVGVVAAALFGGAGIVRTARERHELAAARAAADRLIVKVPTSRDTSELVRWRCAELTSRARRDRLSREIARTVHALDPGLLPSASPLRRPEARASRDLLMRLETRLGDERPVSARGVLFAQTLLRDPASPLYSDEADETVAHLARRVLGALEP